MIHEITTHPRKVLEARIELWNRNTGEITFPKTKASLIAGQEVHPWLSIDQSSLRKTHEMLRHYVAIGRNVKSS